MNKKIHLVTCFFSMFITGISTVSAEKVAIQANTVFIVDNSVAGSQIIVKNLTDGTKNACLSDRGLNLLGLTTDLTATDIVVKDATAVITTFNASATTTDVKLVDVAGCLTNAPIPVKECITTVSNGVLTIPCVQYNGQMLSVVLEQRGNSMNWELKSSPILNDTFKNYKLEDDSEEDDQDHGKSGKRSN